MFDIAGTFFGAVKKYEMDIFIGTNSKKGKNE